MFWSVGLISNWTPWYTLPVASLLCLVTEHRRGCGNVREPSISVGHMIQVSVHSTQWGDALCESDSTMHVVTLSRHVLLPRASGAGTSRCGKGWDGLVLWYVNSMRPDSTQDQVVDQGIALPRGHSHSHDRSVWSDKAIVGPCKWDATNNCGDTVWSYSRLLLTQHGTEGGAAVETSPLTKGNV